MRAQSAANTPSRLLAGAVARDAILWPARTEAVARACGIGVFRHRAGSEAEAFWFWQRRDAVWLNGASLINKE